METIGQRLERCGGVGPGFDVVRLGLALLVLYIHSSLLSPDRFGQDAAPAVAFLPIERWAMNFAALPMFFAVSGFLVAASAERTSLGRFMVNRALRIFPALIAVTLVAAFALGPILTAAPLGEYFSDRRFWTFLLNGIGYIHYELPGMFGSNPVPNIVNGALWTVPHELSCYAIIAGLVATGLYRRRSVLLAVTASLYAAAILTPIVVDLYPQLPFGRLLEYVFVTRGAARLVPVFLTGMLIYRYREAIPCRASLGWIAGGLYLALCAVGSPAWQQQPLFNAAASPLLAYAIVIAGLSPALKFDWLKADYSYGVYVSGYVVQQTIVALVPGLQSVGLFFALAAAGSLAYASLSWRFVEKPALALRHRGRPRSLAQPETAQPLVAAPAARRDAAPAA